MNKEKVYILQKDLPDGSKIGDEYIKQPPIFDTLPNLVYENKTRNKKMRLPFDVVETNPAWFRLKNENPRVTRCNYDEESVYFYIDDKAPSIKVDKDRLAEILIAEREGHYYIDDKFIWYREDNEIIKDKKYSEQQYLEFGQKCFEAARKNNSEWYYKFKNFSDYMNSQKPKE
jgi:hypothetical protein